MLPVKHPEYTTEGGMRYHSCNSLFVFLLAGGNLDVWNFFAEIGDFRNVSFKIQFSFAFSFSNSMTYSCIYFVRVSVPFGMCLLNYLFLNIFFIFIGYKFQVYSQLLDPLQTEKCRLRCIIPDRSPEFTVIFFNYFQFFVAIWHMARRSMSR